MEDNFFFFPTDQGWGDGFGMIQVPYIYRALYFYYYYISSTSDHQRLGTPDLQDKVHIPQHTLLGFM